MYAYRPGTVVTSAPLRPPGGFLGIAPGPPLGAHPDSSHPLRAGRLLRFRPLPAHLYFVKHFVPVSDLFQVQFLLTDPLQLPVVPAPCPSRSEERRVGKA